MNLENYEETRLPKARAMCSTCLCASLLITKLSFRTGYLGEVPQGGHEREPAHMERQGECLEHFKLCVTSITDGSATQVIDVEVPNSVILKARMRIWSLRAQRLNAFLPT